MLYILFVINETTVQNEKAYFEKLISTNAHKFSGFNVIIWKWNIHVIIVQPVSNFNIFMELYDDQKCNHTRLLYYASCGEHTIVTIVTILTIVTEHTQLLSAAFDGLYCKLFTHSYCRPHLMVFTVRCLRTAIVGYSGWFSLYVNCFRTAIVGSIWWSLL